MATLNRLDGSCTIPDELPVVALRDLVYFPYMVVPLLIGRAPSVAALEEAEGEGGLLLLVAQKDPAVEAPGRDDLYRAGTVIRVVQVAHLADGTARVVMEGLGRARIVRFLPSGTSFRASVELLTEWEFEPNPAPDPELDARVRTVKEMFREYVKLSEKVPDEVIGSIGEVADRVRLAHLVAGHLLIGSAERQELLEVTELPARFEILREILVREIEILRIQQKLDEQIRFQVDAGGQRFPLEEDLRRAPVRIRRHRSRMGRAGRDHRAHDAAGRRARPREQGVRPSAQAQSGGARGVGDPHLPGLDPGAPVDARDPGQPGCGPGRRGPRRRALRSGRGEGEDPGPHRRALAGGETAGSDTLSRGTSRGGQDVAGPQHRPLPGARIRSRQPGRRP